MIEKVKMAVFLILIELCILFKVGMTHIGTWCSRQIIQWMTSTDYISISHTSLAVALFSFY